MRETKVLKTRVPTKAPQTKSKPNTGTSSNDTCEGLPLAVPPVKHSQQDRRNTTKMSMLDLDPLGLSVCVKIVPYYLLDLRKSLVGLCPPSAPLPIQSFTIWSGSFLQKTNMPSVKFRKSVESVPAPFHWVVTVVCEQIAQKLAR